MRAFVSAPTSAQSTARNVVIEQNSQVNVQLVTHVTDRVAVQPCFEADDSECW
jgi:hypothetical protein